MRRVGSITTLKITWKIITEQMLRTFACIRHVTHPHMHMLRHAGRFFMNSQFTHS